MIRETEFPWKQNPVNVWIQWANGDFDEAPKTGYLDKIGKLYLPVSSLGNGRRRKIVAVSLSSSKDELRAVHDSEPRYEGKELSGVVLHLGK